MQSRFLGIVLVLLDLLSAVFAWTLFFYLRKLVVEHSVFQLSESFYYAIVLIPVCWLLLYYFQGTYHRVRRLYRFRIFNLTLSASFIGSILIFFTFLLDDEIDDYHAYYKLFLLLFGIHFVSTLIPRFLFVTALVKGIQKGKGRFQTLLIGGSEKAVSIYNDILADPKRINEFVGFVNINGVDRQLENSLNYLGHIDDLHTVFKSYPVEEVIIALETTEHAKLRSIISRMDRGGVMIKVLPDMYDILSGSVKMTSIFGALLLEVNADVMPLWQQAIKRFMDVLLSILALLILLPFLLTLMLLVKLSSKGPIFFLQERIGINGKPFNIIKYRTMYTDAEKSGPQLSSAHDPRITSLGRIMRKFRLDELPQFVNVLKGDMSLVGPRPERQFYIDKIVAIEPEFLHLNQVRPGITSWGQVKYGYAENVDQMVQRMKFDLLYLKNRSLALDVKIMLYTALIIVKAKGK